MGIFDLFGKICGYVLWIFYDLFNSYGLAIICFTLILMLIMFPFEVKRTRSMAQNLKISKKAREIQEKYAKNREKMNEEIAKLYQEEGSPMKGCLSQMLTPFVFFGIFAAIRQPLSLMFGMSAEKIQSAVDAVNAIPGIKNLDGNFIQLEIIKRFSEIRSQLPMFDAKDVQNIADFNTGINFFGINLLNKPDGSSFDSFIWVIPVIAAITALIPIFFKKLNGAMAAPVEGPGKGCNKILPVVFVGLFIWMVWANPAALGIYYIISNVFRLIQSYIINKFYNINIYNAKCEAARIALLEQEEANVKQDFSLKRDFKINNNNNDKKKK